MKEAIFYNLQIFSLILWGISYVNLCSVKFMQSWNSTQQQRLTEPIRGSWLIRTLSGFRSPPPRGPCSWIGTGFYCILNTVKTQNVFTNLFIEKKFQVDIVSMNVSDRNEVVLYHLHHPLVAAECSLTACIGQPWKTQPRPLCLQGVAWESGELPCSLWGCSF